jgi:hypothetical protein
MYVCICNEGLVSFGEKNLIENNFHVDIVYRKYKVKVTPGTSKRGKAIKTAMNMFMTDKSTSTR